VTDRRLLFFGDSLVAGVGDPSGRGWVGRVVGASFGAGLPLTAYNLGVRRETSEQVAARWRNEALPRLLPEADVRIVVSFGANDTTIEHGRLRVAPERSCLALDGILHGAAALGLIPLVIGPAPVDGTQQNERIQALSASFSEVCSNADVRFIGVVEQLLAAEIWMPQVKAGDGAHPSAAGGMTRSPSSSWPRAGRTGYAPSWPCGQPASATRFRRCWQTAVEQLRLAVWRVRERLRAETAIRRS
jgi:acyl-CoA thioesterase-1